MVLTVVAGAVIYGRISDFGDFGKTSTGPKKGNSLIFNVTWNQATPDKIQYSIDGAVTNVNPVDFAHQGPWQWHGGAPYMQGHDYAVKATWVRRLSNTNYMSCEISVDGQTIPQPPHKFEVYGGPDWVECTVHRP